MATSALVASLARSAYCPRPVAQPSLYSPHSPNQLHKRRLTSSQSTLLKRTTHYPWNQQTSPSTVLYLQHSQEIVTDDELETMIVDSNTYIEATPPPSRIENCIHDNTTFMSTAVDGTTSTNTMEIWGMPVQSILLLNLVAVIWGTQHAVIKSVVDDTTAVGGTGLLTWIEHVGILKPFEQQFVVASSSSGETNGVGGGGGHGDSTAAYFTLARFGLAALLSSPYTPGLYSMVTRIQGRYSWNVPKTTGGDELLVGVIHNTSLLHHSQVDPTANTQSTITTAWRYGVELGLYMFLGYAFQAIGLETTTASRSGFLLYLNVKLVPFFSYFIFGKRIPRRSWISAFVAFGGTALLALDQEDVLATGSTTGNGWGLAITEGDLWSIAAAAASAIFILRMEAASKAIPKSSELNAATLWTVAALSFLWTMGISLTNLIGTGTEAKSLGSTMVFLLVTQQTFHETISTIAKHLLPLVYLSGVTTALANFLQSKAQKNVSAERASVIYAMDPVYGAIFANILLGETLGELGRIGAVLIVLAAAANAIVDFRDTSGDSKAVKAVSSSEKVD